MRVALYLGAWWGGGHQPVVLDGVVDALLARGHDVHVWSGIEPRAEAIASFRDAPHIEPGDLAAGCAHFHEVAAWARDVGADHFVDLYLDWTLLRLVDGVDALPPSTFVLHQIGALNADGPSAQHAARAFAVLARDRRHTVVVHTEVAARALTDRGVRARRVAVPIRELPRVPAMAAPGDAFLFVGNGRADKGLVLAVAAAEQAGVPLRVSGSFGARERDILATTPRADVQHLGFLDDRALAAEFARAVAVVCPYPSVREAAGSGSTVALEALSCGVPVVLPTYLVARLPTGVAGVVAYDPEGGTTALAAALTEARARRAERRAAAGSVRETVRAAHSFAQYGDGLLGLDPARQPAPVVSRAPARAARQAREPALVSVVIPARDAARTIGDQLDALARQTYSGAYEVVVVDNGSTDGSAAIVEQLDDIAGRLRVVHAPEPANASHARNVGARAARGDLLAFCDADDRVDAAWLGALVGAAAHDDLVGGRLDASVVNSPTVRTWRPEPVRGFPHAAHFLPFAPSNNLAVWADAYAAVGGFDPRYGRQQDVELSWRAQLAGFTIGFAPGAIVHYRHRDTVRGVAKQAYGTGIAAARLYRDFRASGMPRSEIRTAVQTLTWLAAHASDLADPVTRGRWVRLLCSVAGRAVGSVRFGVRYV